MKYISRRIIINPVEWDFLFHAYSLPSLCPDPSIMLSQGTRWVCVSQAVALTEAVLMRLFSYRYPSLVGPA